MVKEGGGEKFQVGSCPPTSSAYDK